MNLSRQFGRVTSGGRLIPVVDGLRFVAIVAVVLYHLEDYLTHKAVGPNVQSVLETTVHRLLNAGHVGVPLFFALSGFILALPFYESAFGVSSGRVTDLRRYYFRRVTRLEPPYLINLAIAGVLLVIVNHVPWSDVLPHFAASALYVHNQVYGDLSTINPVAWSLEIEVQFYIIAPWLTRGLIALPTFWRRLLPLMAMAALIATKSVIGRYPPHLALSLPGTLEHFLAGMFLADLYVTAWRSSPRSSAAWDFVSAVVWPAILLSAGNRTYAPFIPLLTIVAYTAAFHGRTTHRLLSWTPAVLFGGMCYSIYLYHFFVISAVGRFTLPWTTSQGYLPSLIIQSALIVPVVFASCAVLFRMFERPFMAWHPGRNGAAPERTAASTTGVARLGNVDAVFAGGVHSLDPAAASDS